MSARRVFGRVETVIDSKPIKIEMRRDGIWLRRKFTRRTFRLPFIDAWQVANGQGLFAFRPEPEFNAKTPSGKGAKGILTGANGANRED